MKVSKLNTVNVVETIDGIIENLFSFPDTPEGNIQVEKLFETLCKENNFDDEEVIFGLEEGYLEQENYKLFIVHSS
jgi:hypothetical protein